MKVGLDALTLKAVSLDPLELLELTRAHGLEGLHFSARLLEGRDDAYVDRLSEEAEAHGLYLELAGAGVNPGQRRANRGRDGGGVEATFHAGEEVECSDFEYLFWTA